MAFIEEWQTRLDSSLAEFAGLATSTVDIDFTYGILATAVLWPIRRELQAENSDAIAAFRRASGSKGNGEKLVLEAVKDWQDDRRAAAKSLAVATKAAPELCSPLDELIAHFDAGTRFAKHLMQVLPSLLMSTRAGGQTFNIEEQVKAALVNIGGFTNVQELTVYLNRPETSSAPAPVEPRRFGFEPETIYIPKGSFLMGSREAEGIPADETPQHEVDLLAYRIGRYPVTNREYAEFLTRNNKAEYRPRQAGWFVDEPPADRLDHPVVGISWQDAQAYCDWLARETGRGYRLPTEAEWEKAARGTEGWIYPWGNEWRDGCCTVIATDGKTTQVLKKAESGSGEIDPYYPDRASPYGCYEMVGNVQEWTSTLWGSDENVNRYPYPYRRDEREDLKAGEYLHRVYRNYRGGLLKTDGDALTDEDRLRCAVRGGSDHETEVRWRGFRVACDA